MTFLECLPKLVRLSSEAQNPSKPDFNSAWIKSSSMRVALETSETEMPFLSMCRIISVRSSLIVGSPPVRLMWAHPCFAKMSISLHQSLKSKSLNFFFHTLQYSQRRLQFLVTKMFAKLHLPNIRCFA